MIKLLIVSSMWLIELSRELPSTAQIDGLDVDFSQCPPKEWLASNVSWITHDIFSEPPTELIEAYDVIHVQLFITVLRDGNPVPMLKNMMKMLSRSICTSSHEKLWLMYQRARRLHTVG
jgi:hypothetical protein